MPDKTTTIQKLTNLCYQFRKQRGWTRFASPANFAKDIVVEAAELLDHFVWDENAYLKDEEIAKEVKYELADVFYGVLMMAHALNVDLSDTLAEKLKILAKKYPAAKCRQIIKTDNPIGKIWQRRKKFRKF
jgi:NTP pyrophosphatase (non-canonical NTP hydrolase)